MRRLAFLGASVVAVVLASACATTPQELVAYDALVAPRLAPSFEGKNGWTVEVSRAELAVGPVYFCASEAGSANVCKTAQAEYAAVTRIDALAGPRSIGAVRGVTGAIRSASYDLGVSWFDTQTAATPSPQAPGGHSLRVVGVASKGADRFPFELDVDVVPQYQGQRAVPSADASADVGDARVRLEIACDVQAWLSQVDWDDARKGGPKLDASTKAHAAVLVGIKNVKPPEFRWVPLAN